MFNIPKDPNSKPTRNKRYGAPGTIGTRRIGYIIINCYGIVIHGALSSNKYTLVLNIV